MSCRIRNIVVFLRIISDFILLRNFIYIYIYIYIHIYIYIYIYIHINNGIKGTFKQRYANHCRDFEYRKYEKSTKLSKYIWKLKNEGKSLMIKWSILKHIDSIPRANYCKLCLTEKLFIINNFLNLLVNIGTRISV